MEREVIGRLSGDCYCLCEADLRIDFITRMKGRHPTVAHPARTLMEMHMEKCTGSLRNQETSRNGL